MGSTGVVAIGVVVGLLLGPVAVVTYVRFRVDRFQRQLATARWVPEPERAPHAPLAELVSALEAEGFAVESNAGIVTIFSDRAPAVVLRHPDGSTAVAATARPRGRRERAVNVRTCLVPGQNWFTTTPGPTVPVSRRALVRTTPDPHDIAAAVAAHREEVRWLAGRGLEPVPVPPGGASTDLEASWRAISQLPRLPGYWAMARTRFDRARFDGPLSGRPGVAARVDELRRDQAAALAARVPGTS